MLKYLPVTNNLEIVQAPSFPPPPVSSHAFVSEQNPIKLLSPLHVTNPSHSSPTLKHINQTAPSGPPPTSLLHTLSQPSTLRRAYQLTHAHKHAGSLSGKERKKKKKTITKNGLAHMEICDNLE